MILAAALAWIAQASTTVTVTLPPKSAPAVYSYSLNPLGGISVKQVTLDNSVQLGPDNDAVFARATPPRGAAYWLQGLPPLLVVFGPTRSVWCVPGAANARPVATFQQVDWQQGDQGTNSYLALLGIVNAPTPADNAPPAVNVIDATEYTWMPADPITCGGQPSITFWDLTKERFAVYVFVITF